jgi:hypothetical protein
MTLTLIITATVLLLMLAWITFRSWRGDFEGNPFAGVLMIVLTCGIIGGLIGAATL